MKLCVRKMRTFTSHRPRSFEELRYKSLERITYAIDSVTYDVIATSKPSYLCSILTIQPARSTRSSKRVTLYRRAVSHIQYNYPEPVFHIFGSYTVEHLPAELRCPKDSGFPLKNLLSKSKFLSKLKTCLFHKSCTGLSKSASVPLLHPDPSHLTWQIHGYQANIIMLYIIKLFHRQQTRLHWQSL